LILQEKDRKSQNEIMEPHKALSEAYPPFTVAPHHERCWSSSESISHNYVLFYSKKSCTWVEGI